MVCPSSPPFRIPGVVAAVVFLSLGRGRGRERGQRCALAGVVGGRDGEAEGAEEAAVDLSSWCGALWWHVCVGSYARECVRHREAARQITRTYVCAYACSSICVTHSPRRMPGRTPPPPPWMPLHLRHWQQPVSLPLVLPHPHHQHKQVCAVVDQGEGTPRGAGGGRPAATARGRWCCRFMCKCET